jgi:hypothetical protein
MAQWAVNRGLPTLVRDQVYKVPNEARKQQLSRTGPYIFPVP